jgi:single-strand DNA-binding protein
MGSVNKVILVGRLGADPELKSTQSGRSVCNLSVATSEQWKDKQTGQKQEKTEWHRVTVWGDQAENCGKFLAKGREVYIEGKLQTRSYEKDGQKHYATDIVADRVTFLGGGGDRDTASQAPRKDHDTGSQVPPDDGTEVPF